MRLRHRLPEHEASQPPGALLRPGVRRRQAPRSRLVAATLFTLLIPIAFVWSPPPALLAGLATAFIAGLILQSCQRPGSP